MSTYLGDYPPRGFSMGAWKLMAITYGAAFSADPANPPMYRRSSSGRVQIKGTVIRTPAVPAGADVLENIGTLDTVEANSVLAQYIHWGNINADLTSRGILVNANILQGYFRQGTDRVKFAGEYFAIDIQANTLPDIG